MALYITESIWLNATDTCSFEHIVEVSGLSREDLHLLVEAEVIRPERADMRHNRFPTDCIVLARKAKRLQEDFELDTDGLILAANLLKRINELEARLRRDNTLESR